MKRTTKLTAIILSLALLLPCMSLTAFAESPEYNQDGFTYVAFGDSYTRGMGCSDTWKKDTAVEYGNIDGSHQSRNVPGSYSYIVAKELGCDTETENGYLEESDATYWPIVQNGQRIAGVMDLLGIDDGYWDSYYYHNINRRHAIRYVRFVEYFGNRNSKLTAEDELYGQDGSVYDVRELIKKADLITLQLGMADVMNRPVYAAVEEILPEGNLNFNGVDAETIIAFAKRVIENMEEGFEYFKKYYPVLLKYMADQNEDGTIIVLGVTNPAKGINISNDLLIPIGDAFSSISIIMNKYIKQWAEEYGLIYVDISNVDTGVIENDWTLVDDFINGDKAVAGTHPTAEGHQQLARQIIRAYKDSDPASKYELKLDIGRFNGITEVKLDGFSAKYSLDDNKLLTVNCVTPFAKTLTIKYVDSSRKTVSSTYSLSWNRKDGYSAYRLSTTNDTSRTIAGSIVSKVTSAIKTIKSKLFSK